MQKANKNPNSQEAKNQDDKGARASEDIQKNSQNSNPKVEKNTVEKTPQEMKKDDESSKKTTSANVKEKASASGKKAENTGSTKVKKSKLAVFNFILILFIFAALGHISYSLYVQGDLAFMPYSNTDSEKKPLALNANLDAKLKQIEQKIATQEALSKTQIENFANLKKSALRQDSAIANMLDKVDEQNKIQSDDWRLAEVEYLLRISNQELILAQDIKSSLRLMQAAYSKLDNMSLSATLPIKKALQEDITNLSTLVNKSNANISLEILAIAKNLTGLEVRNLKTLKNADEQNAQKTQDTQKPSAWQNFLSSAKSLVIIKTHQQMPKRLQSLDFLLIEKQRLLLLLNQASWASLHKDVKLYKETLSEAINILKTTFADNSNLKKVLQNLQKLATANLELETGKYNKGLQKLEDFMLSRYQLPMAKPKKNLNSTKIEKTEKEEKLEKSKNAETTHKGNKTQKVEKAEEAEKDENSEKTQVPAEKEKAKETQAKTKFEEAI